MVEGDLVEAGCRDAGPAHSLAPRAPDPLPIFPMPNCPLPVPKFGWETSKMWGSGDDCRGLLGRRPTA